MFGLSSRKKSNNYNRKKNGNKYIAKNSSSKKTDIPTKRQYVSRRAEVYGIVIVTLSILFFFSFFSFGRPGIVTGYFNDFLSYVFGITKYVVALLLFVWGISFFIRRVKYLPSRFGWGFAVIFISVAGLLGNNFKYADIFDPNIVIARGGIIGAGIFYGLFRLVGKAGAVTILSVLALIGILIVTRVSMVDLAKRISAKRKEIPEDGVVVFKDNSTGKKTFSEMDSRQVNILNGSNEVRIKKPAGVYDAEKLINGSTTISSMGNISRAGSAGGTGGAGRTADDRTAYGRTAEKFERPLQHESGTVPKTETGQLKIPIYEDRDREFDENYKLPPLSILKKSDTLSPKLYRQSVAENVNTLNQLFYYFNLPAKIASVTRGPSITLYEVTLSQGVKVAKLLSLEDDFCVALGSPDLRFLTPIPGKSAIGIEVPNKVRSLVTLGDIFSPGDKLLAEDLLTIPLGKSFSGDVVHMTINNMPHILIAGATNSGKSVCLNSIIIALLMKVKPSQVKLIMVDPKMVELSMYNGIPHLLAPVIVDPRKAAFVLSWVLDEMKNRFQLLLDYNCKTLEEYNFMVKKDLNKDPELKTLPYILVIIDELADLMMIAASEVEDSVCRIAQMARAVGIHLIISTQKPVVKILTGLIKTNIPARIAFKVTDYTDSRVILEHGGAEKLIGKGDMLYLSPQFHRPERLQGAFVTTKEIGLITNYIKSQMKAEYSPEITDRFVKREERILEDDELLYDALRVVVEIGHASASLLQRKLRLGYSRAARIIDQLQDKGFIGGYDGSKPREVLVSKDELEDMLGGKED